jgi:Peptidase family M48
MKIVLFVYSILFITLLASCGPTLRPPAIPPQLLEQEVALQRELLLKTLVDRKSRLQRIYTPLRIANADLCGSNVSPVTGIIGIDRQSLPVDLRPVAQRLYGVTDGILVIDVVPNSPAADAGIQSRDVITGAATGKGVMPSGWSWSALTIPDLVKVIETSGGNPITLLMRRTGTVSPLIITPRVGCNYSIEVMSNDDFNAFADGRRIVVYTGLFNHVPDDREIAVIVGHELAHNILRHREKREGNAAIGGAAGLAVDIGLLALGINTQGAISRAATEVGAKAYSQEFESEADYLGIYMLARAGFEIGVAPDFYRRMGVQHPSSQSKNYFSTHPSTTERAVSVNQTISEIQDKASRKEALLPKNLEGQALAVNRTLPAPTPAVVVTTAQAPTPIPIPAAQALTQSAVAFAPVQTSPAPSTVAPVAPASVSNAGQRLLAQLYLIKGPVVSNPPQTFSGEFLSNGKAQIVLSGRRLLTGDFDLVPITESIQSKYKPTLIKVDGVQPISGADAKGFAALSDGTGVQMECAYSLTKDTGRGQGMCADNQGNTYRIVFD